jgi:3-phosphoshikimate 1-carboxyvinyltransferase
LKLHLYGPTTNHLMSHIRVTGSKSETNRSLLLAALYKNIAIENLSNSDDAQVMQAGLEKEGGLVDIHHAGTAMRFLTSYFASRPGVEVELTGSQRMTERPVQILVEALRSLGAQIAYLQDEGYPPLRITGKELTGNRVSLPAHVSSQYISSLLLVAPSLKNGIEITLVGEITSVPYIQMTLALLQEIGVETLFNGNTISVSPLAEVPPLTLTVESDWSSASYFYSLVALADVGSEITLSAYKEKSLQGDSVLASIYAHFGVTTTYGKNTITLKKSAEHDTQKLQVDLVNAPDIAQTIAVTCFGLGVECLLTGLHTLKIKETDRLVALETELKKLGAHIAVTDRELELGPALHLHGGVAIDTYNDHRMAMAFAPLALRTDIIINDAGVVSKSYPDYWKDLGQLGFRAEQL